MLVVNSISSAVVAVLEFLCCFRLRLLYNNSTWAKINLHEFFRVSRTTITIIYINKKQRNCINNYQRWIRIWYKITKILATTIKINLEQSTKAKYNFFVGKQETNRCVQVMYSNWQELIVCIKCSISQFEVDQRRLFISSALIFHCQRTDPFFGRQINYE